MSLRELAWMAEARQDVEWARTAALLAMVKSMATGKTVDPDDLHPMRKDKYGRRK